MLPSQVSVLNLKHFINPCKQTWFVQLSVLAGSILNALSTFDCFLVAQAVTPLSVQNHSERYVDI